MPEKIDSTQDEFFANLVKYQLPSKNIFIYNKFRADSSPIRMGKFNCFTSNALKIQKDLQHFVTKNFH